MKHYQIINGPEYFLRAAHECASSPAPEAMLRHTMNHWVHHRGQMTVYLRLMGPDVLALYGSSADDTRFD